MALMNMFRPMNLLRRVSYFVGAPLVSASNAAFDYSEIMYRALALTPSVGRERTLILQRFAVLVLKSSPLVALASFAAGALMALQFGAGISRFGGELYVPTLVTLSILKALGPMLASLMVAARAGGGLAAELASMKITQQTDAIEALGSDPSRKLIMPNLLTLMIGLPCLTILADTAGLLGGALTSMASLGLPSSLVIQKMSLAIQPLDLLAGALKTLPQGLLIGVTACHFGLGARGGTSGIGQATTSTIMVGTVLVLLSDLVLTKLLWFFL